MMVIGLLLCLCGYHFLGIEQQLNGTWIKEYSLEVRAELPQTTVTDSQPSLGAGRPEGLVELSATEVTCLEGRYEAHTDFTKVKSW